MKKLRKLGCLSERAAWSAAVALWVMVFALAAVVASAEQNASQGAYDHISGEQIMERAARVWDELAALPEHVTVLARPMETRERSGRLRKVWDAEILGQDGASLMCAVWSADTGRLLSLFRQPPSRSRALGMLLPRADAMQIAREALPALEVVDASVSLGNAVREERDGSIWTFAWRVECVSVGVWVDARTGHILHVWRGMT